MLIATDLTTGERIARYPAHFGPLNAIAVTISGGRELVLTGGDDGIARVFDIGMETKEAVAEFDDGRDCPVTAVEWSSDGNQCFVGGVDNEIKVRAMPALSMSLADENRYGICELTKFFIPCWVIQIPSVIKYDNCHSLTVSRSLLSLSLPAAISSPLIPSTPH